MPVHAWDIDSWVDLQFGMGPSPRVGFKSNQKANGYPHDIHIANVPAGIFCQVAHYCSLQHSQLGKSVDDVSPSSLGSPF